MKSFREMVAAVGVATAVGLVALNYGRLPGLIATHFNAEGGPDGYGSKATLLMLAGIAVGVYGLLSLIHVLPRRVNVGRELTELQESKVWSAGVEMVGWVKAEVAWMFAYLSYVMVGTAQGTMSGVGAWFMPVVMVAMAGTMGVFGVRMLRGMRAG